jgi:hypothetical protein
MHEYVALHSPTTTPTLIYCVASSLIAQLMRSSKIGAQRKKTLQNHAISRLTRLRLLSVYLPLHFVLWWEKEKAGVSQLVGISAYSQQ